MLPTRRAVTRPGICRTPAVASTPCGLLHTSDWHLGRSLHREDLLSAQAAFVDFLVELVRAAKVDVVLVSGDLYDRALPQVDAVRLCDEALRRLAGTGARTVVISGNHDSARRLGFGADLIDGAGVHLRTDPARVGEPVLIDGDGFALAVHGVPYLEPDAVRQEFDGAARGHAAVLGAAMSRVRADLARRRGTRSVVLAHAFVTGAQASDSERDISVGGVCAVPVSTFAGIDYVALGHLHGAQALRPSVRYSGSPLAYSFSEERHTKAVLLVDIEERGLRSVETVPCPVPRALATLRGELDDLLGDPGLAAHERRWLSITLTDRHRPRDAMERLRARFPHTLQLAYEPSGGEKSSAETYAARLRGRSDLEIVGGFVDHVRGTPPSPAENALLADALAAHRLAEAGA
jgi:exonuclease SbcD